MTRLSKAANDSKMVGDSSTEVLEDSRIVNKSATESAQDPKNADDVRQVSLKTRELVSDSEDVHVSDFLHPELSAY